MSVTTLTNAFVTYGPLTTAEVWTVLSGTMTITTDGVETDPDKGAKVAAGQQMFLQAGLTVYAKSAGSMAAKVNRDVGLQPLGNSGAIDQTFTGPAAQTVLNTNLIDGVLSGWTDVSAFNSIVVSIIGSAGVSAGTVVFETTNDISISPSGTGVQGVNLASGAVASSTGVPLSSTIQFAFNITAKYFRARLSAAVVGGSAQASITLSQRAVVVPQTGAVSNVDNQWYQESITPLGISGSVNGSSRDVGVASGAAHRYSAFNLTVSTDQTGSARIEASNDNATWHPLMANVALVAASSGFALQLSVPVCARYHRGSVTNSTVAQTRLLFNTSYTAS